MATQVGIGVYLIETESGLIISGIKREGAAAASGNVRIGDFLVAVNGFRVTSSDHAKQIILGPFGTSLEAEILRGSQSVTVTLWRGGAEAKVKGEAAFKAAADANAAAEANSAGKAAESAVRNNNATGEGMSTKALAEFLSPEVEVRYEELLTVTPDILMQAYAHIIKMQPFPEELKLSHKAILHNQLAEIVKQNAAASSEPSTTISNHCSPSIPASVQASVPTKQPEAKAAVEANSAAEANAAAEARARAPCILSDEVEIPVPPVSMSEASGIIYYVESSCSTRTAEANSAAEAKAAAAEARSRAPCILSDEVEIPVLPVSMSEASSIIFYFESSCSSRMPNPFRPSSQYSIDGSTPIPHGKLKDFYGGIDKRIGIVSLDFYEQMRKEHCDFAGFNFEFTSDNYKITTCPEKEWRLVTEGLGAEGCQTLTKDNQTIRRRFPAYWWNHENSSNSSIMFSDTADAKLRSEKVIAHLRAQFGLLTEELIAIILFTGPMYTVYNGILSSYPEDVASAFRPVNFTTTIHAIISAIQKLSLQSPVQNIVYRGTSGRGYLPDCFWSTSPNGLNEFGYTEFGVMSMTSSKQAALQYSGVLSGRKHPAVLAFAAGAVDRGARVQPLSQFPFEVEFTFPPLSYIQPEFVDGTLRIEILEHPDKPGVEVPVIYVRVNANIRSPTLDELNWARKQSHISAFRSQNRDTADDIRKMCNERKSDVIHRLSSTVISDSLLSELRKIPHSVNSVDSVQIAFEVFQSIISQECEDVLKLHEQQPDSAFVDKFEHSRLVTEMISTRKWASAKLLWFIEDDALAFRNILHYPLEKSYREYVSFCRNRIRKEVNDSRKRKLAFLLCKLVGLVPSQHDATKNETPIVLAVENGACAEDVELLLDAGYPVDSVTREGNSILSTAVRYGYTQTAELLIYRGADVNFMNTKDGKRTPMIFAAVHGHAGCLQLLLDCGAEPSAECLQYARQHKNFPCVDVLLNAGAIDDYGDDSSSIVSQNPALWHGSAPPRVVNDGMDQFAVPRSCSHITPISPSKARREGFPTQRPELARAKSAVILDSSAHTSRIHLFNSKLLDAAFDPIATITSVLSVKNEGIKKRYIKSILFRIVTKAFTFTFSDQVCIDVLRLILRSNPDSVSECDANGYLPLHVAVESGASLAVVVELLKAYPEAAQKRINSGFTALHLSSLAGRIEVCKCLVECQTDVNAKDDSGRTALHLSSENGYMEVCRLLVERQADVNAKDNWCDALLTAVEHHRHFDLIPFLAATTILHLDLLCDSVATAPPSICAASGRRNDHGAAASAGVEYCDF